jgi:hypothetical protein
VVSKQVKVGSDARPPEVLLEERTDTTVPTPPMGIGFFSQCLPEKAKWVHRHFAWLDMCVLGFSGFFSFNFAQAVCW